MDNPLFEIKNASVSFRNGPFQHQALDGVQLKLEKGEHLTIIGGNGAGKSTLFGLIAGEHTPSQGQLLYQGKDVTKQSVTKRSRWVSRVFQDPRVGTFPELTVEENLALAAKRGQLRKLKGALDRNFRLLMEQLLEELDLGLERFLKKPMGVLSGGQRQAIALIMATLQSASILLLDEHTAALDPKTADKVLKMTQQRVERQGVTTLMITHSMSQALSFGERTLMMQQGRIERDLKGDERAALTPQSLIELFDLG